MPDEVAAFTPWQDGFPLLGVSAEVGVLEAQAIGGFNVARPAPGPAAADTAGAIAGHAPR